MPFLYRSQHTFRQQTKVQFIPETDGNLGGSTVMKAGTFFEGMLSEPEILLCDYDMTSKIRSSEKP
jgi:hypothetical protein